MNVHFLDKTFFGIPEIFFHSQKGQRILFENQMSKMEATSQNFEETV
jgi:hypothetical protein